MDDEALLETFLRMTATPGEYRPEAIAAARDEVARRDLTTARQRQETSVKAEAFEPAQDDAVRLALDGHSISVIEARLKSVGVDDATAATVARRAGDMPADERKWAGRRAMSAGAAAVAGGAAITGASYYLAGKSLGVGWGLMLAGLLEFFRGLRRSASHPRQQCRGLRRTPRAWENAAHPWGEFPRPPAGDRGVPPGPERRRHLPNVTSGLGALANLSDFRRRELADPELTRDRLAALMVECAATAAKGWGADAYGVSKAALNAWTRILARELAPRRIRVNAPCPGWVRTEMGGRNAPRSVEGGAASVLLGVTLL